MITTDFQPEDFNSWLEKVPGNESVMSLLFQIYQYDQLGKMGKKTLIVGLNVREHQPEQDKHFIDQLSEVLKYGLLDDVVRIANKKKNRSGSSSNNI